MTVSILCLLDWTGRSWPKELYPIGCICSEHQVPLSDPYPFTNSLRGLSGGDQKCTTPVWTAESAHCLAGNRQPCWRTPCKLVIASTHSVLPRITAYLFQFISIGACSICRYRIMPITHTLKMILSLYKYLERTLTYMQLYSVSPSPSFLLGLILQCSQ